MSGKQSRFQRDCNHVISKRLAQKAKCTSRNIALEDLSGISRKRKVSRELRARLGNWSFDALKIYTTYKTELNGFEILSINPCNTSRECSECGCVDKKNRKTQEKFLCVSCGHAENADSNASKNIRNKGLLIVNKPMVPGYKTQVQATPLAAR